MTLATADASLAPADAALQSFANARGQSTEAATSALLRAGRVFHSEVTSLAYRQQRVLHFLYLEHPNDSDLAGLERARVRVLNVDTDAGTVTIGLTPVARTASEVEHHAVLPLDFDPANLSVEDFKPSTVTDPADPNSEILLERLSLAMFIPRAQLLSILMDQVASMCSVAAQWNRSVRQWSRRRQRYVWIPCVTIESVTPADGIVRLLLRAGRRTGRFELRFAPFPDITRIKRISNVLYGAYDADGARCAVLFHEGDYLRAAPGIMGLMDARSRTVLVPRAAVEDLIL